jgi:hypothetical protein
MTASSAVNKNLSFLVRVAPQFGFPFLEELKRFLRSFW